MVSSNLAIKQLNNVDFRKLVEPFMTLPSFKQFRYKLLPGVYDSLIKLIDSKLNSALSICLIIDIWTSVIMSDYIGLSASLRYESSQKEVIVIGFERMTGRHTAQNVKSAIEKILNSYSFDKKKISGNYKCVIMSSSDLKALVRFHLSNCL